MDAAVAVDIYYKVSRPRAWGGGEGGGHLDSVALVCMRPCLRGLLVYLLACLFAYLLPYEGRSGAQGEVRGGRGEGMGGWRKSEAGLRRHEDAGVKMRATTLFWPVFQADIRACCMAS